MVTTSKIQTFSQKLNLMIGASKPGVLSICCLGQVSLLAILGQASLLGFFCSMLNELHERQASAGMCLGVTPHCSP